jgi:high-affinity iron transporter
MQRVVRLAALVLLLACAFGGGKWSVSAAERPPVDAWNDLDDALFAVQAGLLVEDDTSVNTALTDATNAATEFLGVTPSGTNPLPDLQSTLRQITSAAQAGDQVEVARLRGIAHGQALVISYNATMAALAANDVGTARQWLLVRTFTQATRLARPSADSTLALDALANGSMDAPKVWTVVSADLLDTYQAEVQRQIDELGRTLTSGSQLSVAESIGKIQSFWPLFAPSYGEQLGPDARDQLQDTIEQLSPVDVMIDRSSIQAIDSTFGNFRAAPLSLEEQSGRARQMVLYLGLVPKEYGRGVRGGEVTSSIEIQEASTFLAGARAAFADLRPSLNQVDPLATQTLSDQLNALGGMIDTALQGGNAADPAEIGAATKAVEETFKSVVPGEWLKSGGDADFDVVISLLEQMEAAAAAGQYKQAESARLEAYAVFDAGAEKRLLAFAPGLAQQIEVGFWQGSNG